MEVENASERGAGALLWRVGERALLPICVFSMALALPYNVNGDGAARFDALDALLRYGVLSTSRYSLIGPLFSAPLYLLGAALGYAEGGVAFFNLTVFILGLIAFHLLLRRHLEPGTLRRFLLLLTVGSMFPAALASYYGETFTAIMVAAGLAAALLATQRAGRVAGWAAVALGVANTPATLLGLALALLGRVWARRRLRYALVGAGALALIAGESLARRGALFATVYTSNAGAKTIMPYSGLPGFSYPFLLGVVAILLSFGKGLLFYTPGLFLPLKGRLQALGERGAALWRLHASWLLFVTGLVLIYASWWDWGGDWFWGPRFFLIASVPASLALAIWVSRPSPRLWLNLLALGLLTLAIWVGVDGAIFNQADLQVCQVNHYQYGAFCDFTLEFSALWRPLINLSLYGPGATFAHVESFQPRAVLLALCAPLAWLSIAAPLLRAIASQMRALVVALWPLALKLRTGWRW
ncbi:MAG TPA: hypothetical protein VFQ25_05310 [Ktedonobacterales bacterium]|nr:hypothetical protein [Ktedonobacterales bacterium]